MELVVRDAAVGYDADAPLQEFVNFSVKSGEVCCILGPNGCGKTTLVRTMLGALPLLQGSILLDGRDMCAMSARAISRKVAYVEQRQAPSLPRSVRETVLLGRVNRVSGLGGSPSRRDYNAVDNALAVLGIEGLADRSIDLLSGGELQLTMFARALAQEPKLLILDEPTAALDFGNAVAVIEKIRELADMGLGVLMITHNPDHAFMTRANVALFKRNEPMVFGTAFETITRQNIQEAYGIGVRLVEFTHDNSEIMRMCAPQFRSTMEQGSTMEQDLTLEQGSTTEQGPTMEQGSTMEQGRCDGDR